MAVTSRIVLQNRLYLCFHRRDLDHAVSKAFAPGLPQTRERSRAMHGLHRNSAPGVYAGMLLCNVLLWRRGQIRDWELEHGVDPQNIDLNTRAAERVIYAKRASTVARRTWAVPMPWTAEAPHASAKRSASSMFRRPARPKTKPARKLSPAPTPVRSETAKAGEWMTRSAVAKIAPPAPRVSATISAAPNLTRRLACIIWQERLRTSFPTIVSNSERLGFSRETPCPSGAGESGPRCIQCEFGASRADNFRCLGVEVGGHARRQAATCHHPIGSDVAGESRGCSRSPTL